MSEEERILIFIHGMIIPMMFLVIFLF